MTPITLLKILASAEPESGTFSLAEDTTDTVGTTLADVELSQSPSNLETISITEPANPSKSGSPSPGGYLADNLAFTSAGQTYAQPASVTKRFNTAVYGMSCYNSVLWSDWQNSAGTCGSVKIRGVTYSGSVQNPNGLSGSYCSAFIAETILNGSGVTQSGQDLQYNSSTTNISVVPRILTQDGDVATIGMSVARDPNQLSAGTALNVDGYSSGLVADDTGGGVKGFRLDVYTGPGLAGCQNDANTMRVTQCDPSNTYCPGADLQ